MRDWRDKLDAFLKFNERDILTNPGKIAKEVADSLALEQYKIFSEKRLQIEAQEENQKENEELKSIEQKIVKRKK